MLDYEDGAVLVHRLGAAAEDRGGPLVVPVVDDELEEVGVACLRGRRRRSFPHGLRALGDPGGAEVRRRRGDDVREVEDDAVQVAMGGEDGGEQLAAVAADVDDPCGSVRSCRPRGGRLEAAR